MKRRQFIGLVIGVAALPAAWPRAARAQQPSIPVIGFLHSGSAAPYAARLAGFRRGLSEAGLVEGRDFAIEFRWAEGDYQRLRGMADDLVARRVKVIVAGGGVASAPVAKAATSTIPIVFIIGVDPVANGIVTSLARPEANITGVSFLSQSLSAKRLGLLSLLAPGAKSVAVLGNPNNVGTAAAHKDLENAGRASGRTVRLFGASTAAEIDTAFSAIAATKPDAIVVHTDPYLTSAAAQIASLGTRVAVPAIYPSREYVEAGGLVAYGPDVRDEYRKGGLYAARLLQGARPFDLPILQPTKFELLINLKTARSIGLSIPDAFQLLADDVIE